MAQAKQADQRDEDPQRLPEEIARRETLLQKMDEACARLEARAKARAEAEKAEAQRQLGRRQPPVAPAGLPTAPLGIGAQAGAPGLAAGPGMAAMPMMPPMMESAPELKATGQTTNLLGYLCEQFELSQHGWKPEIWATERLLPFPGYLPQQPIWSGPRMLEEQWPELLRAKKLFPLRVSLDGRLLLPVSAVQPR
jgi:hypothetical protein